MGELPDYFADFTRGRTWFLPERAKLFERRLQLVSPTESQAKQRRRKVEALAVARLDTSLLRLVEHHAEHRRSFIVFVLANLGLGAKWPHIVRGELLPTKAGSVERLTILQSAIKSVLKSMRSILAIRSFGPFPIRPAVPFCNGMEPVTDIHQHHCEQLKRRAFGHRVGRAQRIHEESAHPGTIPIEIATPTPTADHVARGIIHCSQFCPIQRISQGNDHKSWAVSIS